jgi:adenylate cyclase
MAAGGGTITKLSDLRAPMSTVFEQLAQELTELQRYKAMYGPLKALTEDENARVATSSEGSDTEQE